jgi:hypothetical protein
MKKLIFCFIIFLSIFSTSHSSIVDELEKLADLKKQGIISNNQFEKAKSIILKIEEKKKNKKKVKADGLNIVIRPFKKQNLNSDIFEKMEMIIGDYRIYTHRPGGIKIRRISDGKQLAVYGDKMRMKYYNNSEKYFQMEKINEDRYLLKFNDIPILLTEKRFVAKHQATFYQVLALGTDPFHYYIRLPNKAPIALNYTKFEKKIKKAVEKAKVELASTYDVTIDQINLLMKRRKANARAEIEKIIGATKDQAVQAAIDDSVEKVLAEELEAALGAALANEFVSAIEAQTGAAIDEAIENELAALLDEVVALAIAEGISAAAIEAGISAYLAAIASGASEEDALAAGDEACGC